MGVLSVKKNIIYGISFLFLGLTVLIVSIFLLLPGSNFFDGLMSNTTDPTPTHTLSSSTPTLTPIPTLIPTPTPNGDTPETTPPPKDEDNNETDKPSDGEGGNENDNPSDGEGGNGNDNPSDGEGGNGNDNPSDGEGGNGNGNPSDGEGGNGNDKPSDGEGGNGNDKPSDGEGGNGNDKPSDGEGGNGNGNPSDGEGGNGNETPSEGEILQPSLKPAQITVLRPVASNVLTKSNQYVLIDYSNTKDGYVMVKFTESTSVRLKVQVVGPTTTYTYNLTPLEWTVFPLSDGNGSYQVKVYRNVVDNRYATVLAASFSVTLDDEFAPFLRPNQYVNYENANQTIQKTSEIIAGKNGRIEKAEAIYRYVVSNISYDYKKLENLPTTYLPDLDQVLKAKKGICFDYAALMTSMLRISNIPCKLVVGYAGTEYHAWISVWSPEQGWIDGVIFFDGTNWQHMDPTFAASGAADRIASVNYTTKYIY